MKSLSEIREGENADYQQTIVEQRLTQNVLRAATDRMKQVYAMLQQQPGAPHIQTSATHTDPGNGPARFNEYGLHEGGKRVLGMLNEVMTDSQRLEDEAMATEEDAQAAYENFMKESNTA